jgi:predicted metal-dependent peptidase
MSQNGTKFVKPPKTDLTDEVIIRKACDAMLAIGVAAPHFLIVHSRVRHLYRVVRDDPKMQTMGITANGRIYLDADFVASLPSDQLGGVLCHELLHLVLMHHQRQGIRDAKLFNVANDMVINKALRADDRIKLPEWALMPPEEYQGDLASEALYDWLMAHPDKNGKKGKNPDPEGPMMPGAGCGVMDDDGSDKDGAKDANGRPIDWRVVAAEMAAVAQQVSMGNSAGNGSTAIWRLLDPREPRVKWTSVLRRAGTIAAGRIGRDYQSMSKRNRRSPLVGAQLPGWRGFSPTICVIADVSGSMGEDFVNRLVSECKGMLKQFDNMSMFFITHTSQVEWSGWITRETNNKLAQAIQFTGGTDPEPAYQLAKQTRPRFDSIVHFTDAEFFQPNWPEHNGRQLIVGIYGSGGSTKPPDGSVVIPCFIDT